LKGAIILNNLKITFHNPNSETDTANFLIKVISKNLYQKVIQEQTMNLISQQADTILDYTA